MTIPNLQIGQDPTVKMLHQISKQLDQLIKVVSKSSTVTTTTTINPV